MSRGEQIFSDDISISLDAEKRIIDTFDAFKRILDHFLWFFVYEFWIRAAIFIIKWHNILLHTYSSEGEEIVKLY